MQVNSVRHLDKCVAPGRFLYIICKEQGSNSADWRTFEGAQVPYCQRQCDPNGNLSTLVMRQWQVILARLAECACGKSTEFCNPHCKMCQEKAFENCDEKGQCPKDENTLCERHPGSGPKCLPRCPLPLHTKVTSFRTSKGVISNFPMPISTSNEPYYLRLLRGFLRVSLHVSLWFALFARLREDSRELPQRSMPGRVDFHHQLRRVGSVRQAIAFLQVICIKWANFLEQVDLRLRYNPDYCNAAALQTIANARVDVAAGKESFKVSHLDISRQTNLLSCSRNERL